MSHVQFKWINYTFDLLRKKKSISPGDVGGKHSIAQASHLLAMFEKAGLVKITQNGGRKPATVTATHKLRDAKDNDEVFKILKKVNVEGTQIVTHKEKLISIIEAWQSDRITYKSTKKVSDAENDIVDLKYLGRVIRFLDDQNPYAH